MCRLASSRQPHGVSKDPRRPRPTRTPHPHAASNHAENAETAATVPSARDSHYSPNKLARRCTTGTLRAARIRRQHGFVHACMFQVGRPQPFGWRSPSWRRCAHGHRRARRLRLPFRVPATIAVHATSDGSNAPCPSCREPHPFRIRADKMPPCPEPAYRPADCCPAPACSPPALPGRCRRTRPASWMIDRTASMRVRPRPSRSHGHAPLP